MTATLRALRHRDPVHLRCPSCGGLVPCIGGPEYATPLGIRRYRKCAQCREPVLTTESVAAWRHELALSVPPTTPGWLIVAVEVGLRAVARVMAWVRRWRGGGDRRAGGEAGAAVTGDQRDYSSLFDEERAEINRRRRQRQRWEQSASKQRARNQRRRWRRAM